MEIKTFLWTPKSVLRPNTIPNEEFNFGDSGCCQEHEGLKRVRCEHDGSFSSLGSGACALGTAVVQLQPTTKK